VKAIAWRREAQDLTRPPQNVSAYVRHAYARAATIRALRCGANQIPDDEEMARRSREADEGYRKYTRGEIDASTYAALVSAAHAGGGGRRLPERGRGQPWVWRSELLLALPLWPTGHIHSALVRLVAEGCAECRSTGGRTVPPREADVVRLTHHGADTRAFAFRYPPGSLEADLVRAAFTSPAPESGA
jgi:hypothetical protein